MDQTQDQKQKQSLSQFIESQLDRKLTQLLLSVSVFSLFFSYSYWFSLFHDTLAFKFLSHDIDKNFIFLLCNGLLVFLAKYSGLITSLSNHNHSDVHQSFKSYEYVPQTGSTRLDPETPLLDQEVAWETTGEALENSSVVEEEEDAGFVEEDEDGLKGSIDDPFVQDIEESESYEPEEEEEGIIEENQVLSNEELNKKFDEFIRKMKEELRIEARQQLVMV
ncbi:hypothetical protein V6N13_074691 [Hibiscus sabdariffa]|uniref:Transmembrane protein n=1 Tax=Hibiscus sabdariffa TaxID=183260 RepID=A0ABR2U9C3_9ROSI